MNDKKTATPSSASLQRLFKHLSTRRKIQFSCLGGLMLLSAVAEMISLGSVLPFVGALTAPEKLFANETFVNFIAFLNIRTPKELLLPMTIIFASAAIVAAVIRIVLARISTRLAYSTGADLGYEVYRRTLFQPYETHLGRNSNEIVASVTRKVDGVVTGVILPIMTLLSSGVLFLAITATILVIDPEIAIITCLIFGAAYGSITLFVRRKVRINGIKIAKNQTEVFQTLREGLSGVRDVLLCHNQDYYTKLYRSSDVPMRYAQGDNKFLAQFPRYALEAVGIVVVSILAFIWTTNGTDTEKILPVLAALALGGQRLLPALQHIYASWVSMLGSDQLLTDTLELLDQPISEDLSTKYEGQPLAFDNVIKFKDIVFEYEVSDVPILRGSNLEIRKGARLGIIGETGSGKSTTIDLLMGLLMPTEGWVEVDGIRIDQTNVRDWQQNIAHVPQKVHLTDASYAENIAFGVDPAKIDMKRVKQAAEQAQISTFIEAEPGGYLRSVGEEGARISGGQAQRLGIARALYGHSKLLVLDEATSALDSTMEASVIDSLSGSGLNEDVTIVMIAHRLTSLQNCTNIVKVTNGIIVDLGSYQSAFSQTN